MVEASFFVSASIDLRLNWTSGQQNCNICSRGNKFRWHRKRAGPSNYGKKSCVSMAWLPAGLLREAVAVKNAEVEALEELIQDRPDHPLNLRLAFFSPKPSFRFANALRRTDGTLAVIPVIKRFQPQPLGDPPEVIAPLDDIGNNVRLMEVSGADAAFVQTDTMRYGVETKEVADISHRLRVSNVDPGMPIACQDLIVHPIQIAVACEAGAAAVTIVAGAALTDLMELLNAATAMGVEAIIECHTELERDLAIECGATLLYLTNFDRSTNKTYPGTAEKLGKDLPPWVLTIGGGGLVTARDAWSLLDNGFNGVALGRSLLQTGRTQGFIDEIRSQRRTMGDPFSGEFGRPFLDDYEAVAGLACAQEEGSVILGLLTIASRIKVQPVAVINGSSEVGLSKSARLNHSDKR